MPATLRTIWSSVKTGVGNRAAAARRAAVARPPPAAAAHIRLERSWRREKII
jgi:hypothetical protein